MDQTVLLWILGASFALNGIQFKLWWNHAKECRDYRSVTTKAACGEAFTT